MATNKLLDDAGLNKLLTLLKAKFPLITSLATINGLSLVNGGNDIEIKGDKDVCFFESTPTINIAAITNGSGVGPIRWRSSSKTFVSESGDKLYNNFAGGDDFGDQTADGRAPVIGKLYIDTVSRKFYYWDSSDLICLTVDTSLYKVVTSLPTPSADTENKIYLVTGAKTATDNTHAEYITVMNGAKYVWEKLGEVGADVDLSQYITTSALATRLSSYYTKTTADSTFLKKTEAATTYMSIATYGYTPLPDAEIQTAVTSILGA